jgi:hypothetical protein
VVRAFLMGCAVALVLVGCAGVRTEAPKEKSRGTPLKQQPPKNKPDAKGRGPQEPACYRDTPQGHVETPFTTNDLPECPNKGGLLLGTDGPDELAGEDGDDEVRGRGDKDVLGGGAGDDVIYGGPDDDTFVASEGDDVLYGGPGLDDMSLPGPGEDEIHGGDGDDVLDATFEDADRDRLYCGKGKDYYAADKKTLWTAVARRRGSLCGGSM